MKMTKSKIRCGGMLTILVLGLGLMVCPAQVGKAAPMSTAFTYQARLLDANNVADGLYDFQFKLFDDPNTIVGNQVGGVVNRPDVDVVEGYFTVELNFGSSVFNGDARWLEIGIRPAALNDPNNYTTLLPRQEITPVPYALQTRGIFVDNIGRVGIGTTSPNEQLEIARATGGRFVISDGGGVNRRVILMNAPSAAADFGELFAYKYGTGAGGRNLILNYYGGNVGIGTLSPSGVLHIRGNVYGPKLVLDDSNTANKVPLEFRANNSVNWELGQRPGSEGYHLALWRYAEGCHTVMWWSRDTGNVGIGTTSPTAKLEVNGQVKITGGSPGAGKVLISDAAGLARWQTPTFVGDSDWQISDSNMYSIPSGNVGIGTTNPAAKLEVDGAILRSGSRMYGPNADTHINLGVDSTTGTHGEDWTYDTIGGGYYNTASGYCATVGGGWNNTATSHYATIGGGYNNKASYTCTTIGGGWDNTASDTYATVGGGYKNTANNSSATVSGGESNTASGAYATVPGGSGNTASGDYSFAAGRRAKCYANGVFAWADNTDADFNVNDNNRFTARASGGVYFYSFSDLSTGAYLAAGSGSWASVSDRNAKENFAPVDSSEVLDKLAALPITTWKYRPEDDSIRHIGPMAQDFYAAFGFGDSDKAITSIDADGISFAAIQGLYQLVREKDSQIAAQAAEISSLKNQNENIQARLAAMEAIMARLVVKNICNGMD